MPSPRRILCLLALASLAFAGLAGCGGNSDSSEDTSAAPEQGFEQDTTGADQDTTDTDTDTTDTDTGTTDTDTSNANAGPVEPHKFHAIVKVAGYRGICEVSGAVGHYAYAVNKRSCFGSFTGNWPFSGGPAGDGNPPFNDGPDRSSFSWDATKEPGKILLRVRNETKNAELAGYTPSGNSPQFFVTSGGVDDFHAAGPITSGTDASKTGQPGGPLNLNVQYSKQGYGPLKNVKAGYWVNLNGYLNYATK